MKYRSILLNSSLITSTGCLAAGYIIAGYWMVVPALLILIAAWVFSNRIPAFWLAAIALSGCVVLAAVGVVLDLSLVLMTVSCTAGLVSWELIQFKHSISDVSQAESDLPIQKYHLKSLALAASTGLVLALISSIINIKLPFGVVALLVLIAISCLIFGMRYITNNKI
jgi:hypothetical protein